MADGDFTVDVKVRGRDEIGRMGRSVEEFLVSIRGMLHEIQDISGKVSSQSETTNSLSCNSCKESVFIGGVQCRRNQGRIAVCQNSSILGIH